MQDIGCTCFIDLSGVGLRRKRDGSFKCQAHAVALPIGESTLFGLALHYVTFGQETITIRLCLDCLRKIERHLQMRLPYPGSFIFLSDARRSQRIAMTSTRTDFISKFFKLYCAMQSEVASFCARDDLALILIFISALFLEHLPLYWFPSSGFFWVRH